MIVYHFILIRGGLFLGLHVSIRRVDMFSIRGGDQ